VTGTGPSAKEYTLGLACAKHYAVNNVESDPALRFNYSVLLEARTTWEYHFRAFLEAVPRGNVASIMASYNSITNTNTSSPDIPTAADPNLLDGMLRGLWKWDGWVVSDYDAWA
jgi:beta-glucosidase-like glycosyl hydrolase